MSYGPSNKKYIATRKCPECGKDNLLIYDNGTYHCGNCGAAGLLSAKGVRHYAKDPAIRAKLTNEYVLLDFIDCPKCGAVIAEQPCEFCRRRENTALDCPKTADCSMMQGLQSGNPTCPFDFDQSECPTFGNMREMRDAFCSEDGEIDGNLHR